MFNIYYLRNRKISVNSMGVDINTPVSSNGKQSECYIYLTHFVTYPLMLELYKGLDNLQHTQFSNRYIFLGSDDWMKILHIILPLKILSNGIIYECSLPNLQNIMPRITVVYGNDVKVQSFFKFESLDK